ncbi:hypothetical protein D3C76_1024950 [compost metagenome]
MTFVTCTNAMHRFALFVIYAYCMTSASSTDSVSAMNVSNLALPDSIAPSILASADLLLTKTAYLAGMVAPETAACLSRLLMDSDAHYSGIIDGYRTEPEVLKNALNSTNQQSTLKKVPELRRRIVEALDLHFHLLQTLALPGAVARVTFHRQLAQLGLHPDLWSLARGLARRREEFQALAPAYHPHVSEPTGAVQVSSRSVLSFIAFMLEACLDEVDYMTVALNRGRLRDAVLQVFRSNPRFSEAGVRPETAPAFFALLIQGALPTSEFETFTGLQPIEASDQLSRLINVGLAAKSASKSHTLEVGIPTWFAQDILPDFFLVRSEVRSPLP